MYKRQLRNISVLIQIDEVLHTLYRCIRCQIIKASTFTLSLIHIFAFYSNDIQRREDAALVCKRPKGNEYKVQDDAWALDFYYAHKDDSAEELVKAVLSNKDMWDQDLTEIKGLEELIVADLKKIREEGAESAYASCL